MKEYIFPVFLSNDERISLFDSSLIASISLPLEFSALHIVNLYLVFFQSDIFALYLKSFWLAPFPSCILKSFRYLALGPALTAQLLIRGSVTCPYDRNPIINKKTSVIIIVFILII